MLLKGIMVVAWVHVWSGTTKLTNPLYLTTSGGEGGGCGVGELTLCILLLVGVHVWSGTTNPLYLTISGGACV